MYICMYIPGKTVHLLTVYIWLYVITNTVLVVEGVLVDDEEEEDEEDDEERGDEANCARAMGISGETCSSATSAGS